MHLQLSIFLSLGVLTGLAFGQGASAQTYVGRYDVFAGFTYLESGKINLAERGVHIQAGSRITRWLSLGFDYSRSEGHTDLTPKLLPTALQQQLGAQFAQLVAAKLIPATYALSVPIDSTTQNFAAGPQFTYRRWQAVSPFVRPSVGAIRETATPHPGDPIAAGVVKQLLPSGVKQDWTGFYGFGGGLDINPTRHFSMRLQADFVHDHLFNDILREGRNTVRVSLGPALQFGRNVTK